MNKYKLIYPDNPWDYEGTNRIKKLSIVPSYPTMPFNELAELPIDAIAAENCVLAMWATGPFMEQAIKLMGIWGFKFVTVLFIWIKTNKHEHTLNYKPAFWTMPNAEYLLFGKKGKPQRVREDIKQVVYAPIGRHSAKPNIFRKHLVNLFGDVSRIELFARERFAGWDAVGNEIDGKDIRVALNEIINSKDVA